MKQESDNQSVSNIPLVEKSPNPFLLWLVTIGLLLVAAGTLMPLFKNGFGNHTFRYVYAIGAVSLLVGRIFTTYKGDDMRIKRLYRIETWSAIFFCVAVFFMFYKGAGPQDWLAFTLAGGAVQVYTSIMIPRTIAKSRREKQGSNIK